jgi:hypothetical protein
VNNIHNINTTNNNNGNTGNVGGGSNITYNESASSGNNDLL